MCGMSEREEFRMTVRFLVWVIGRKFFLKTEREVDE